LLPTGSWYGRVVVSLVVVTSIQDGEIVLVLLASSWASSVVSFFSAMRLQGGYVRRGA
jgi:hypothetical protein